MEAAVDCAAATDAAAARPGVRDAVEGYGTELVLGPFLDELLSDPFRERARERLTRGWERPSGSPATGRTATRSGRLIDRLAPSTARASRHSPPSSGRAARTRRRTIRGRRRASPDDDEALRVSSILAMRNSAAACPRSATGGRGRCRRQQRRLAHRLVLRHVFGPTAFASVVAPWRPRSMPEGSGSSPACGDPARADARARSRRPPAAPAPIHGRCAMLRP